jgi:hypothetical protein
MTAATTWVMVERIPLSSAWVDLVTPWGSEAEELLLP